MEIHYVEITKVYKNRIEYRQLKSKTKIRLYSLLLLCLVPVLAMGCLRLYSETTINEVYKTVCNLYNPIYSPYAETGSISFVGNIYLDEEKLYLDMPILSSNITIDSDGVIIAKVKESILIKAMADGVVEKVAEKDGVKRINILHSNGISVEYINIDIAGVNEGNIVKRGKEIATGKLQEEIMIKIFLNNKPIKNVKIEDNKIIWQS